MKGGPGDTGIPESWGVPYLGIYFAYQKLLVADGHRFNVYGLDHVNGDGIDVRGGPLYLNHETGWNHQTYTDALFKLPSTEFLDRDIPFLKFSSDIRKRVINRLEKSTNVDPQSIYKRYLGSPSTKPVPGWFSLLWDSVFGP
jgi:hypothetical protein